jgi:ATPase family AAA domain-containing protein 2
MAFLLNEDKPQLILDESHLSALHTQLAEKSSGLSLEQLEQVNATLMDCIWKYRAEYNRNKVAQEVSNAFNDTVTDIQAMQRILKASQEEEESQMYRAAGGEHRYEGGSQVPMEPWGFARRT